MGSRAQEETEQKHLLCGIVLVVYYTLGTPRETNTP